jgi:1-phosphatidylinositol-4-phosphate 5-kinase
MASMTVLARPNTRSPSPPLDSGRQSYISSSTASYQTARDSLVPGSHHSLQGSSRSSINTLGPQPFNHTPDPGVNSIHTLGRQSNGVHAEEACVSSDNGDAVRLESGPFSDGFFNTVGNSLACTIPSSSKQVNEPHIGPPPPSPPASVERVDEEYPLPPLPPPKMQFSKSEPMSRPVKLEGPIYDRKQSEEPAFGFPHPGISRSGSAPQEPRHRSSTDTKISLSTFTPVNGLHRTPQVYESPQSMEAPHPEPIRSQPPKSAYQSADGHLQPPPPPVPRPTRRNTTGSSPRVLHTSMHHAYGSQPFADGDVEEELASDIQMQADQIRRERNSKRAKAQQQAEAALTRSASISRGEERQVLVGNLIGEDHVNYVLMYNMLTGIRIAVRDGH